MYVVYWSQSGNTQAMAEAIGAGITAAGKEAKVLNGEGLICHLTPDDAALAECKALGEQLAAQ